MKTKFTLLVILTAAFFSAKSQIGQVPNNTFQDWGNSQYAPNSWCTYSSIAGENLGVAYKDSDVAYGGYVPRIVSGELSVDPGLGVIPSTLSLGTGSISLSPSPSVSFAGVAFPYRPDTIFAAYTYYTPSADSPNVVIVLTKQTVPVLELEAYLPQTPNDDSAQIILGYFPFTSSYLSGNTPDTLLLQFNSSTRAPVAGSTLTLYYTLFGYVTLPTGLQQVADKMDFSLYPNPAAGMINISSAEDAAGFKVVISDMSGKFVYGGTLNGSKTSISTESFASGMYICRIADASGNILQQDKFVVAK